MFLTDIDFNGQTITFLSVGLVVMLTAAWCARHSLRGEARPGRFYTALVLYAIGYTITILSGSLKTLLAGWELIGIASFLVIALHRNMPFGNSAKAFFIYRLGDVGLLLAMWASQHLWRNDTTLVSLMVFLTASAQSSQLPFSSWLPQAMENSTAASALLLATLTVQMGVYLLLRSAPVWEPHLSLRILIGAIGLAGSAMAAAFGRVQVSYKRTVAYTAMAHTGLIFIEVAAGLKSIALVHIATSTIWHAYRLVIPPNPLRNNKPTSLRSNAWENALPKRLKYSLYMMYWKEWGLYARLSKYLKA